METIGSIQVVATINTKDYEAAKKSIEKGNEQLEKGAESTSKGFSSAWVGAIAGVAAALTTKFLGAITSSIDGAVRRVDTLNNSARTFENMGIASADSAKAMAELQKSIKGLPTPLDSAVRGMTDLTATYGDVNKGQKVFSALNNAILGFGGTAAMVDNAITQLSQLPMDGPLDAQTWNSLRNSGITPVLSAMAKDSGVSVAALKEAFGSGELTVQDFTDRLLKLNSEGGGGLVSLEKIAKDSTKGIGTGMSNAETAITRGVAAIVTAIGSENISNAITAVGKAFEITLGAIATTITWLIVNVPKAFKAIGDFGRSVSELFSSTIATTVSAFATAWQNVVLAITQVRDTIISFVNGAIETLKNAGMEVLDFLYDWRTWFKNIAIVVGTILTPTLVKMGAQAVSTAARWVASMALIAAEMVKTAAVSVLNAAKTSVAWTVSAAKTSFAWVTQTLPQLIAGFVKSSIAATINAVKVSAAFVASSVKSLAAWVVATARIIAGFVLIGAQALFNGAKVAAGMMLALGPIGLIIAAVAGLTALIIANFETVKGALSGFWDWLKNSASAAWDGVKAVFSSVGSFFAGIWETIKRQFTSIGSAIGSAVGGAFKGVINTIVTLAENTINGFIKLLNGAINIINKIPGVDISKVSEINIPKLAKGGIVPAQSGGILANIGEGRHDEAVIPLDNRFYDAIGKSGNSGETVINNYVSVQGAFSTNAQEERNIATRIGKRLNEVMEQKGLTPVVEGI